MRKPRCVRKYWKCVSVVWNCVPSTLGQHQCYNNISVQQPHPHHHSSRVRPVNDETIDNTSIKSTDQTSVKSTNHFRGLHWSLLLCILENLGFLVVVPKKSRRINTGRGSARESASTSTSAKRDAGLEVEATPMDKDLHEREL